MRKFVFKSLVIFALVVALPLGAQEQTGAITGQVLDNQNLPLPGATVEAKSKSGLVLRTLTDANGRFRFPRLPIGLYDVEASLSGFQAARVTDLKVDLGKELTVNFTLQAGFAEEVTVTASAAMVDVTSNATARSFTAEEMASLPLGRDFSSVVNLAPGSQEEDFLGGISVDGASGAENQFFIDGVNTTDPVDGVQGQGLVTDFIQEVQVKSAGYNAEFGGSLGGVINVVTKSGGNQFAGDVGFFYRNDSLEPDSRGAGASTRASYLDGRVCGEGLPCAVNFNKDEFTQFEPIFNLGGPIMKDRLWFFVGFDYRRTEIDRTPWETGTDPRNPTIGSQTFSQTLTRNYFTGNIKGQLRENLLLKFAANLTRSKDDGALPASDGTTPAAADLSVGTKYPRDSYTLFLDWLATSNLLVNARLARYSQDENAFGYDARYRILFHRGSRDYLTQSGVFADMGDLWQPVGFSTVPSASFWASDFDKWDRDQAGADVSYYFDAAGSHQVKGGVQYIKLKNNESYGEVGNLFIVRWGLRDRFGIGVIGPYGSVEVRRFREEGKAESENWALFLQDSWAILPNFTLNYGIRAEQERVPNYGHRRDRTLPKWAMEWDFQDKLAPRIGFSWDVFKDQKVKVYGSWGKYFDIMKLDMPRQSFGAAQWISYIYPLNNYNWPNFPNGCHNSTNNPADNPCPNLGNPVTIDLRHPTDPKEGIDPDLKPMENREWQLGLEFQLTRNGVLGARYVNKKLINTIEDIGYLVIDPATGARQEVYITGNPGKGIVAGDPDGPGPIPPQAEAIRDYQALELSFERRFADNWFARAFFTLSQLEGNYSGLASSDEFGRVDPNIERYFDGLVYGYDSRGNLVDGPLNTDRPWALEIQAGYRFPWKTLVSVSTSWLAGTPRTTIGELFGVDFFPNGRNDMGRGPIISNTDLTLAHDFSLGGYNLQVNLSVFNLFNEKKPTRYWTYKYQGDVCDAFADCDGTYDWYFGQAVPYDFDTVMQAAGIEKDPRYGKPVAWQAPRLVRLGVKFSF